jgi:hypothetical protein
MKRLFLILAVVGLASCCPSKAYLESAKQTWGVIGPEYTQYIKSDAALDDASKATRLRTAELFTELLSEGTK